MPQHFNYRNSLNREMRPAQYRPIHLTGEEVKDLLERHEQSKRDIRRQEEPPPCKIEKHTSMTRWARHLDMCDTCHGNFPGSGVLCPTGAAAYFYRLVMPDEVTEGALA